MCVYAYVHVCVTVCVCVFEVDFPSCPEMSWFTASLELLEDTNVHAQCRSHLYVHTHRHTHGRGIQTWTRKDCDDQSMSEWEPLRECTHTHTCTCTHTVYCMRCECSIGHRPVALFCRCPGWVPSAGEQLSQPFPSPFLAVPLNLLSFYLFNFISPSLSLSFTLFSYNINVIILRSFG